MGPEGLLTRSWSFPSVLLPGCHMSEAFLCHAMSALFQAYKKNSETMGGNKPVNCFCHLIERLWFYGDCSVAI